MSFDFGSSYGRAEYFSRRLRRTVPARLKDFAADVTLRLTSVPWHFGGSKNSALSHDVLLVGIEVPGREHDIHRVISKLSRSTHHRVDSRVVEMGRMSKFDNINRALGSSDFSKYEWVILVDDDIKFEKNFLDRFLTLADVSEFVLCQPAHRFHSFATFALTRRRIGALSRETRFVEIGPLTALRKSALSSLHPFPDSRWCYGIDVLWSQLALENRWRLGIVDGTPIEHTRPVARSYDGDAAIVEGAALLKRYGVTVEREEILGYSKVVLGWFGLRKR